MKKSKLKYISIILVIATIINFDAYLFDALNKNFGIPYLRFTFLYLFLLPGFIIMNFSFQKKHFKAPHLFFYLLFIGLHYYVEVYMFDEFYTPDFDLINRTFKLYFAYVVLVNYGRKEKEYMQILKVCLYLIIFVSGLFYLGFLGVINTGELSSFEDGRTMSTWNLNVVSDLNILGIYIAFILNIYHEKIKIFKIKITPKFIMYYLLSILIFTATRGSILLFIFGVLLYLKLNFNVISLSKRVFFISIIFAFFLIFILVDFLGVLSNNIFVFDRLLNASYQEEARYLQIIASWNNFTNNIWFGVGYNRAAGNLYDGIKRSNFQYSQILGAGGLTLFITYFTFIFKMFLGKLKNRSNLIIVAMLVFVLISFIFRRIEMYYAIIGYIVYVESRLIKNRYNHNHFE